MAEENTSISNRYWKRFPATYRTHEMKILANWIMAGESGTVVGLSGTGRTTLLGFLCYRPDALQPYFSQGDNQQIILVPVDLINLPMYDLATLYRTILRSFYEIHEQFGRSVQIVIHDLYRRVETDNDPFLPQSALRELLLLFQTQGASIGLVINRFDRFCENATLQMTNTLRGLRDSFKETLFYIVSLPQEVIYLSHLESILPLRDILDTNICWVGPLQEADARHMIAYRLRQLANPLPEQVMLHLLDLTGGYPSLIRVVCNWLLASEYPKVHVDWAEKLLSMQNMRHRLGELWHGLTQEEQQVLSEMAKHQTVLVDSGVRPAADHSKMKRISRQLEKQYVDILPRLAVKGVCQQDTAEWRINGRLLMAYAADATGQRGKIWFDDLTGNVYQGKVLVENLAPLESAILQFLYKHPYIRHTHTALIEAAWPDDVLKEGVSTEALYQTIRGIRKKIEPEPAIPRYIINWRGQPEGGYQFFPEGRPTAELSDIGRSTSLARNDT